MNKLLITIASIILFISLGNCRFGNNKILTPIIFVKSDTINIGKVKINDSLSIKTTIKNIGDDSLYITNLGFSCGCTNGKLDKNPIAPLDSAIFSINYRNEDIKFGQINKTIILENNSKETFKIIRLLGEGAF